MGSSLHSASSCSPGLTEPSGHSGYGSGTGDTLDTVTGGQECSGSACNTLAVCLRASVESGTCLFCDRNGDVCQSPAARDPNLPLSLNMPVLPAASVNTLIQVHATAAAHSREGPQHNTHVSEEVPLTFPQHMSRFVFELLSRHSGCVYSYGRTLLFHLCYHHIKLESCHSDAPDCLNLKQSLMEPTLNHAADLSFLPMLQPPPHIPEFLSIKTVRDLPQQGDALQPAEADNGRRILLHQIPGSTAATYFPDGYLLSQDALWVQHRQNMFQQASANLRQLTFLFSNKVSASPPASRPAMETQLTLCC